ncbi:DUF4870 domain-containing protein [Patescibacteria group bacterium]|nr:DUF4870 domain-containing protein [Patescibacteria group bacterium]
MEAKRPSAAEAKDIEENKVIAAIGYIFILCLVPLLFAKDSKFAQFHAKQGLALFIVDIIFLMINAVIGWIPIIGWFIALVLTAVAVILSLTGLVKALAGEYWKLPLISDFAKKLNL